MKPKLPYKTLWEAKFPERVVTQKSARSKSRRLIRRFLSAQTG